MAVSSSAEGDVKILPSLSVFVLSTFTLEKHQHSLPIGGFQVTSSPPCRWTVNKRSLISSLCLSTSICSFHHCYLCLPRLHENHLEELIISSFVFFVFFFRRRFIVVSSCRSRKGLVSLQKLLFFCSYCTLVQPNKIIF